MELTYASAERLLGSRYGIGSDRLVAFRGRLQHLQRRGFPTGINSGKGKRASYGWGQIAELIVALDLISLGLTPDLVSKLVADHRRVIKTAIQAFCDKIESPSTLADHLDELELPAEKTIFLVVFNKESLLSEPSASALEIIFEGLVGSQDLLKNSDLYTESNITVNLGRAIVGFGGMVAMLPENSSGVVAESILAWANSDGDDTKA